MPGLVEWMRRHGVTGKAFQRCPGWVQVCVWIVTAEIIVAIFAAGLLVVR